VRRVAELGSLIPQTFPLSSRGDFVHQPGILVFKVPIFAYPIPEFANKPGNLALKIPVLVSQIAVPVNQLPGSVNQIGVSVNENTDLVSQIRAFAKEIAGFESKPPISKRRKPRFSSGISRQFPFDNRVRLGKARPRKTSHRRYAELGSARNLLGPTGLVLRYAGGRIRKNTHVQNQVRNLRNED